MEGAIIGTPASLKTGDAVTAAAEHVVPTTPMTSRLTVVWSAAARPPSAEQLLSIAGSTTTE